MDAVQPTAMLAVVVAGMLSVELGITVALLKLALDVAAGNPFQFGTSRHYSEGYA